MYKMGLENINNDIKEIAKKIQELEKSNLEARAMIEAKRDRESRAIKQTSLIQEAQAKLDMLRKTSVKKEDYFNREVCDHHNGFCCDF